MAPGGRQNGSLTDRLLALAPVSEAYHCRAAPLQPNLLGPKEERPQEPVLQSPLLLPLTCTRLDGECPFLIPTENAVCDGST